VILQARWSMHDPKCVSSPTLETIVPAPQHVVAQMRLEAGTRVACEESFCRYRPKAYFRITVVLRHTLYFPASSTFYQHRGHPSRIRLCDTVVRSQLADLRVSIRPLGQEAAFSFTLCGCERGQPALWYQGLVQQRQQVRRKSVIPKRGSKISCRAIQDLGAEKSNNNGGAKR
jgi:hypothetical protein